MILADGWKDYEIIDARNGEKLERWGNYILRRPDPQIIWDTSCSKDDWNITDAKYNRSKNGGGKWEFRNNLPEKWMISYKNLNFHIKPTPFKHTGLFPEQAANWEWMIKKIKNSQREIRVLNLFAYTGGATVACVSAGANVCHVDSSKGIVAWAKENINISGLSDKKCRFIVDDVIKFIKREKKRGSFYDAIIMDPPSYGRGTNGEVWQIQDKLFYFISECVGVLSKNPLFFLINSYTTGYSPYILENILKLTFLKQFSGKISTGEVGIPIKKSSLILPCGIYCRWESEV